MIILPLLFHQSLSEMNLCWVFTLFCKFFMRCWVYDAGSGVWLQTGSEGFSGKASNPVFLKF